MAAQLTLAVAKADSEQLAKSLAESELSALSKDKTLMEFDYKEKINQHRAEMSKKESQLSSVSGSTKLAAVHSDHEIEYSMHNTSSCCVMGIDNLNVFYYRKILSFLSNVLCWAFKFVRICWMKNNAVAKAHLHFMGLLNIYLLLLYFCTKGHLKRK